MPGMNSPHNWTYRMKLRIEELLAYDGFNDTVKQLVARRETGTPRWPTRPGDDLQSLPAGIWGQTPNC